MKKFLMFAAMAAILVAYGCNEERIYLPDVNADGRVIGTIQGVVTDAADNTLLPGVEVSTTVRGSHVTTVTDATGHYSFTNLDPGEYELTFIFPIGSDKEVKSAYAGVHGDAYIPTLDELDSPGDDMPNDEDFRYEVEANVELFPLNGGASGYVTMQTDYATVMPAEGVTVVADFGDYYYSKSSWNYGLIENEWFATTDEDGWYTFSGLPTGINGMLRTLPYLYEGTAFDPRDTDLILEGGGTWLAQTMNLGGYDAPAIIAMNWASGVPFAVTGTFTATFNIPMNPATFTATLDLVYDKSLVPVTVTWAGNTVSVNPNFDLLPNAQYRLDMGGWSMDGQAWSSYWYIDTVDIPQPYVVSTNFEDVPFGVDDDLVLLFSEAMDPATFEIWFGYDKLGDILFDATWSLGNTTLTIDPVLPLDDGNYYYLNISGLSASGMNFYDNFYFETERFQNVAILEHNWESPFPAAGNVVMTFSEAMDPTSFEPFGNINLTQYGSRVAFDVAWSVGNTVLTLNPWVDFTAGANLGLTLDGMSADGQDFYGDLGTIYVYAGNNAFVVDHNIVTGEFPLDGNLEFLFSDPMAPETVVTVFDGLFTPIHGVQTWSTDYLTMTFNPDVVLVASTLYSVAIDGETAEGGLLDGGKDDNGGINGYNTTFTTVGGLQYEWNNLVQVDGSTDNVPVDIVIQLHFNLELDLLAENTVVTLYNTSLVPPTPIHMTYTQPEPGVLQIVPTEVLPLATSYAIAFRVFSYLPGDGTATNAVFGGPVPPIVFTTVESPTIPVEEVAGLTLASTWDGDFRTVLIPLEWAREPNATGYYVYARYGDEAKDDYVRVGQFAQSDDETQTGTVNLAAVPANTIFDTRPSPAEDTFQTPYDGGMEIWFIITAVNSLGEGPRGDHIVTSDISGPNGDFLIDPDTQDVSADDSGAVDGEDLVVTLLYTADEYLDLATVPVITVTEESANSGFGDPGYVVPAENIAYQYVDANGFTVLAITLTVADGKNAAGDSVRVTGFKDSSGNDLIDAGTPWELVDATDPTGAWTDQTDSADNSLGADGYTFDAVFTANELLDHGIVPTVGFIEAGGDPTYVIPTNLAHLAYAYDDDPEGFTTVTVTVTMDAATYGAGDNLGIDGLRDLAGNVQGPAVLWNLTDTTKPGGEWTSQSVSADNTGDLVNDLDIVLQFTCPETLDNLVDPVITITGDNVTYTDGEFTYNDDPNFGTVLNVQVTLAAGESGDGVTVTVNGLTDIVDPANVQTTGIDWVLVDVTAPAAPANLVATDGEDAQVTLNWDDNTEADLGGYSVYRSDVAAVGPYTKITADLVAVSTYVDDTAVNGTQYWYAVTATDLSIVPNQSDPSNVDTATPVAPPK